MTKLLAVAAVIALAACAPPSSGRGDMRMPDAGGTSGASNIAARGDSTDVTTPADTRATPYSTDELEAARALAWTSYGPTGVGAYAGYVAAPRIQWIQGVNLDCDNGTGYTDGTLNTDGTLVCWGGQFFVLTWTAKVAVVPGRSLSYDGVLAHEMGHAVAWQASYWTDGAQADGDSGHVGRAFCDIERGCEPNDSPASAGWAATVSASLSDAGW
jgi:hypothetical protein